MSVSTFGQGFCLTGVSLADLNSEIVSVLFVGGKSCTISFIYLFLLRNKSFTSKTDKISFFFSCSYINTHKPERPSLLLFLSPVQFVGADFACPCLQLHLELCSPRAVFAELFMSG